MREIVGKYCNFFHKWAGYSTDKREVKKERKVEYSDAEKTQWKKIPQGDCIE